MKRCGKRCIVMILFVMMLITGLSQTLEPLHLYTSTRQQESDLLSRISAVQHLDGQIERTMSDVSARFCSFPLRFGGVRLAKDEMKSRIFAICEIFGILTLLSMSFLMMFDLNISGIYSDYRKIITYLHHSDGKKKSLSVTF
ncbi:hypothetical protein [Hespellia stercorisuis]|uniref:Uncharacterized protein n=1 Tax=Hespellia stercorisuis DSM 15480 TaxID=1121950 RepID=A0A1M6P9Z8_9FIRM|nr:hypothetical protein [Hespellia stercorisuis]SHK04744.1 hypothetical protein SAMN02745243_02057 [Hespellia stercorisuis DSM 15480]